MPYPGATSASIDALHREFSRRHWPNRGRSQLVRRALRQGKALARNVKLAVSCCQEYGELVRSISGVTLARQFVHQLLLYTRYGFPPSTYYQYGLFHGDRRAQAQEFIHHDEIVWLLKRLVRLGAQADAATLTDKAAFYAHCAARGIKTVPVLGVFDPRSDDQSMGGLTLPEVDLFSKPTGSWCGLGARRWRFLKESSKFISEEGKRLSADELYRHLMAESEKEPLLIQPCIENHPALQALSGGGLCTLRVTTARLPDGTISVLRSVQRLSVGSSVTDNFAGGGLACSVSDDGVLGAARPKEAVAVSEDILVHPDTGVRIPGFRVPLYAESCEAARQAHQTFEHIAFVGWDIVATPRGVIVLEGNVVWCVELAQIPGWKPLGDTAFPALYLHHWGEAGRAACART